MSRNELVAAAAALDQEIEETINHAQEINNLCLRLQHFRSQLRLAVEAQKRTDAETEAEHLRQSQEPSGDNLNLNETPSSSSHKNADSSANHIDQLSIPVVSPKLSHFTNAQESENKSKEGEASKESSELEATENQPKGTKRKLVVIETERDDVIQLIGESSSPAPVRCQTSTGCLQPSEHSPTLAPKKTQRADRDYCSREVDNSAMANGGEIIVFSEAQSLETAYRRCTTTSDRDLWTHGAHLDNDPSSPLQFEDKQPTEPRHHQIVVHGDTKNDTSARNEGSNGDDEHEERIEEEENPTEDEKEDEIFAPPLLIEFKEHVAADIMRGIERGVLKCYNHVKKLRDWSFESTPSNRTWRNYFRNSGLLRIKDVSYRHINKDLIAAFVERWHPETNSFHMPFGEMTITLEDVHCLTGLSIEGYPVMSSSHSPRPKANDELVRLLGLTPAEYEEATRGAKDSSVKLEWLKTRHIQYVDSEDEDKVLYAARAYALYVFGSVLFPNKSGTCGSTLWLEYLEDMEGLHRYAWGAATLAYLYKQLGNASKGKCKQIAGYLTLLEAWIYERFPTLLRRQINPAYTNEDPLAMKWTSTAERQSQRQLVSLRRRLNNMTATEVNWTPYASVRQRFPEPRVTYYDGCICANDVIEPYMPDRVLRQYGYIQTIPKMPYVHRYQRNGLLKQDMKAAWTALARHFNRMDAHLLSGDRLGRRSHFPWQCSDDYMEWFVRNSHVRVQNPKHV